MFRAYNIILASLIILLLLPVSVPASNEKMIVAVLEFDVKGDLGIQDAGAIIAEWMIGAVHRTNEYDLKERVLLKKVLAEQDLGASGVVDKETASKIGKVYGVKGIITGSVIKWGKTISVTARLIDTDNGSILKTATVKTTNVDTIPNEIDTLASIITGRQREREKLDAHKIEKDDRIEKTLSVNEEKDIPFLRARVTDLRFFDSGRDLPSYEDRGYSEKFSSSTSRYISWELDLEHPSPGRRMDFEIVARYYNPDGSLLAEQSNATYIEGTWTSSQHSKGWGWESPGSWKPGEYRVDIFVKGKKTASGSFEVSDSGGMASGQYDIPSLRATMTGFYFFESGLGMPDKDKRVYNNKFSRSTSRYINWELNIDFPEPGRRIDFEIVARYYNPDGSLLAEQSQAAYIEKGWTHSWHSYGRGWEQPGKWNPGMYRVDLFVKGKKTGSASFEIY